MSKAKKKLEETSSAASAAAENATGVTIDTSTGNYNIDTSGGTESWKEAKANIDANVSGAYIQTGAKEFVENNKDTTDKMSQVSGITIGDKDVGFSTKGTAFGIDYDIGASATKDEIADTALAYTLGGPMTASAYATSTAVKNSVKEDAPAAVMPVDFGQDFTRKFGKPSLRTKAGTTPYVGIAGLKYTLPSSKSKTARFGSSVRRTA